MPDQDPPLSPREKLSLVAKRLSEKITIQYGIADVERFRNDLEVRLFEARESASRIGGDYVAMSKEAVNGLIAEYRGLDGKVTAPSLKPSVALTVRKPFLGDYAACGIEAFIMPTLPTPIPHTPEKRWFENTAIPVEQKLDALVEYARRIPAQRGLDACMTPERVSDYIIAILEAPNMKMPRTHHTFLLEEEAQISILREWRGFNGPQLRTAYLVDMAERYREILKK